MKHTLCTVTRFGSLDLTISESFNVHALAQAMGATRGEEVRISVLSRDSLGLKVVKTVAA